MIPLPRLAASGEGTSRRVLLPESSVSKKLDVCVRRPNQSTVMSDSWTPGRAMLDLQDGRVLTLVQRAGDYSVGREKGRVRYEPDLDHSFFDLLVPLILLMVA